MSSLTTTKFIKAPREKVFEQISDFENAPKRISAIKRVEMLTNGSVGKGTRFRETRIMFKREATEEMEVVSFDRPKGYVLGANSCGCQYRFEFRLTDRDGGTDVQMTFEAKPLTFFAKLMSFMMKPMMKTCLKMCEKDIEDIKTSIESGRS